MSKSERHPSGRGEEYGRDHENYHGRDGFPERSRSRQGHGLEGYSGERNHSVRMGMPFNRMEGGRGNFSHPRSGGTGGGRTNPHVASLQGDPMMNQPHAAPAAYNRNRNQHDRFYPYCRGASRSYHGSRPYENQDDHAERIKIRIHHLQDTGIPIMTAKGQLLLPRHTLLKSSIKTHLTR